MAKKSIAKKRKKHNGKKWGVTPQAPLCALGEVLRAREVFHPLHDMVAIRQKTVVYRPSDKLVFVVLGMLSGAETVSEIQTRVRLDRGLLGAFGYPRCADASVIQQTLDASTQATVSSLEAALAKVRLQQSQRHEVSSAVPEQIRVDIDLSAWFRLASMPKAPRKVTSRKSRTLIPGSWHGWSAVRRKRYFLISYIRGTPAVMLFSRRCLANLRRFWGLIGLRNVAECDFALMPDLAQMLISITHYGGVSNSLGRCIPRVGSRS